MSHVVCDPASAWTAGQVVAQFGDVPLGRVRLDREPGMATEEDVVELHDRENRLYELVDGMLLEKTVSNYESYLAMRLGFLIQSFLETDSRGIVLGADGMLRLAPGLVRIPDVSFISWDRLPGRTLPQTPIWGLAPELAVEIVSVGNTKKEMERKLHDYFDAGVRCVWYVDPRRREVQAYSDIESYETLGESETLHATEVLAGFQVDLRAFFAKPGPSAKP